MDHLTNWLLGRGFYNGLDCLRHHYGTISVIAIENALVLVGYVYIAIRTWRLSRTLRAPRSSRITMGLLIGIFLWCGVCSYGFMIARIWIPLVGFYVIATAILAVLTWGYALSPYLPALFTPQRKLDTIEAIVGRAADPRIDPELPPEHYIGLIASALHDMDRSIDEIEKRQRVSSPESVGGV